MPPDEINALNQLAGFKIYPNPAKEYVNISFPLVSQKFEVLVVDALGREVLKSSSANFKNESMVQLPLHGLSTGLYFIKIKTAEKEIVTKLNVE